MRMHDCNWMQIERYLDSDDRIVLPLGSTEQHGYLSLGTDAILAERIALEGVELPDRKPLVTADQLRARDPAGVRELLGDGSYGGRYQRPDEEVLEIWRTGVEEVRELLESGWR